ncbi:branched-chain amino acid transport system II carrier protein [Moraxella equi]|uniref:Branched-chain amino acid transport system carrier protein n=1 Tax=Moraxella equi TaxID=60442 RepID=A0A378QQU4_9GAMM|nr:branched-chain amino acid transport system II carrier protein [Moraxella equi]OPH40147.1 branched-chain amino acid transport system II carrier protein [Moraxella equi]STZ03051.1 LIV-II [Moraxella equi]
MNKNTLVIGFMLFAFFFGSGNLIFPPKLGFESGQFFISAILGFILTGVGLPLVGLMIGSKYDGGYQSAFAKIHPWFSIALLSAIYLTIAPFFVIPRTGAVAYEMAVVPFLDTPNWASLLIFTVIYYAISLWLSINPSKLVDRIGSVLTPVLLVTVLSLIVMSFAKLGGNPASIATDGYQSKAFFVGFLEGYNTMDMIASVAFSVIVMNAISQKLGERANLFAETTKAGLISTSALALIYLSLGWIGNHLSLSADELTQVADKGQNIGTFILNKSAVLGFGSAGGVVLGLIASLACLTTTVGLTVSASEYFHETFPKIGGVNLSYKAYVIIFTLIGFVLANQGLSAVISKSIPVLLVLYPITITAMILLGLNIIRPLPVFAKRVSLGLVTVVSVLSVAGVNLPLKEYSMEWLPFAIIGLIAGLIFDKVIKK